MDDAARTRIAECTDIMLDARLSDEMKEELLQTLRMSHRMAVLATRMAATIPKPPAMGPGQG
jgi:hypothetical protein